MIPSVHYSSDFGSAIEFATVYVVYRNLVCDIHFNSSSVHALYETETETDNRRNCHTAEEAEFLIAFFNSSITCHKAGDFFLIYEASYVRRKLISPLRIIGIIIIFFTILCFKQIASCNVQSNKFNLGIVVGNFNDRTAECITRHNDNCITFGNSSVYGSNTGFCAVTGRFIILKLNVVSITVSLARFVSGLVERLVGDVAVVGNHRNFYAFVAVAFVFVARGEREATCNDSHNKKRYE